MSIWEKLEENPGTIPFFGTPAAFEVDTSTEWTNVDPTKDIVVKITFPEGMQNHLEMAAKAIKFFDGELISAEKHLIIIKADLKMLGYVLAFAFRDKYFEIPIQ